MVQLSVNVDGHKDEVKKPPEGFVEVPIPSKPDLVRVKRGRCSKTVICITVVSIVLLLAVGAVLLGVFLSRKGYSWEDCFWGDSGSNENWHDWDGSHSGEHHGSGSHGNWSHGGHSGHGGHGGHSGGDHDHGGHGGEDDDGGPYNGDEGDHFPDGRP